MASAASRLRRLSVVLVWTRTPRARRRSTPAQRRSKAPGRPTIASWTAAVGPSSESWAESRPASASAAARSSSRRWPFEIRLTLRPSPFAWRTKRGRPGRSVGSPPVKLTLGQRASRRITSSTRQTSSSLITPVLAPALGEARGAAAGVAEAAGQVAAVGEGHLGEDRVAAEVRGEGLRGRRPGGRGPRRSSRRARTARSAKKAWISARRRGPSPSRASTSAIPRPSSSIAPRMRRAVRFTLTGRFGTRMSSSSSGRSTRCGPRAPHQLVHPPQVHRVRLAGRHLDPERPAGRRRRLDHAALPPPFSRHASRARSSAAATMPRMWSGSVCQPPLRSACWRTTR